MPPRNENIITKLPGIKGNTDSNKSSSLLDAWSLLLTDNFLEMITYINKKITQFQLNYGDPAFFTKHIDKIELYCVCVTLHLLKVFVYTEKNVKANNPQKLSMSTL